MDWECVDLGGFSGIVEPGCGLRVRNLRGSKPVLVFFFSFFRRDALKEQFGKNQTRSDTGRSSMFEFEI